MRWPHWTRTAALGTPAARRRRGKLTDAERRRRDEQFIPLEVGRLEERRVLAATPAITGAVNSLNSIAGTNNPTTAVSVLIARNVTSASGIAITHVDNSAGQWNYKLPGGSWTPINNFSLSNLGGVSSSSALLLDSSDLLQFVPNNSATTGSYSLTFLAWNGSGTAGDQADPTANPGFFSSSSATTSVSVIQAMTISGTAPATLSDTAAPINPFSSIQLTNNVDPAEDVTVTVTPSVLGAVGQLSIFGFTQNPGGIWTFTGTASTAQADLQNAATKFMPARVLSGASPMDTLTVTMGDLAGNAATPDSATVITVNGSATAPADPPTATFTAIANDITDANNMGEPVAQLLASPGTMLGIGVTSVDVGSAVVGGRNVAGGVWEFSTDNGRDWNSISGVSSTAPLLLSPNDLVRFVPNSHFVGTATLTYLTWDPSGGGMNGQPGDNSGDAGQQLFSADTVDATIAVNPPLVISGTGTSTTLDTGVDHPFANVSIVDNDNADGPVTISFTMLNTSNALGTLSISSDFVQSGNTWTFTNGSLATALTDLQNATFTPDHVLAGDTAKLFISLTVTDVATQDTLTDTNTEVDVTGSTTVAAPPNATLPSITNSNTTSAGESVAELLGSPANPSGIAVTGVNDNSGGTWQYFLTGTSGAMWTDFPAGVAPGSAVLLTSADLVRFVPTAGFVGMATLSYQAWDPGSGGTNGQTDVDVSGNPNDMVFSTGTAATATITVNAPLVIGGTGTSTTLDTGVDHPFANVSIVDNDNADGPVTISFTLLSTSNALGTLSISSDFVQSGNTWTFTDGSLATALTDLQNATFTPDHVLAGDTAKLFISLTVTDVTTQDTLTDTHTEVDVTGTTTVSTPPNATLSSITNTDTTSAGESVADLLGNPTNPPGIAVTGVNNNSGGTWQYFLTGTSGAMWTAFPAGVAPGSAVLLTSADLVRFVPTAGFVGTATLSYQAWDPGSGGTNGQTDVDVSGNPNDMVFSIGTAATATITVNAPLVISGTGTSTTLDTGVDHPFANVSIVDNDNADGPVTISFTMLSTSNALGTLSISSDFVQSGNTWTFTNGSLATALTDLQNATFTPDHVLAGDTAKLFISLTVTDVTTQDTLTDTNTVVDVTGTSAAPSLATGNLTAIVQGASTNSGTSVSQLLGSTATPTGESLGIAVTGVDDTNGVWEYSIGGGPWIAFTVGGTGGAAIGSAAASFPTTAVLLSSADSVRFVPNSPTWAGISSITFVAHDTLSGGADGGLANVSGNPNDMVVSASGSSKIPVIGPPSVPSQTILVPVGDANGNTVGTVTSGQSNFSFLTELGDAVPAVSYSITGGNSSGAFHIDPTTGVITVLNSAAITYSPTPLVLTVTASYTTSPSLTGTAMTLTSPQVNTTTIELWQVTTSATQISADASTTLTVNVQFDGPSTQAFPVSVNWGDGSVLNESLTAGTYNFTHIYPTNPDKANPAAAIPIDVTVTDFQDHSITANTQAPVPGTGFPDIAVVPPSTTSVVLVATQVLNDSQVMTATLEPVVTQENDLGLAPAEVVTSTGRQVSLKIVSASGDEGDDINVPDQSLSDLPKLFNKLPDGRYRIYLSEDGRTRLVIDVVVRQGRPVDPSEDTNGTSERPPTGDIQYGGADNVAADGAGKQSTVSPQPSTTPPTAPQLLPPPVAPVNEQQPSSPTSDGATPAPGFDAEAIPSAKSTLPINKPTPSDGAGAIFKRHGASGHTPWEAAAAGVGIAALLMESQSQQSGERAARVDELMRHSKRRTFSAGARLARKLRRAAKE